MKALNHSEGIAPLSTTTSKALFDRLAAAAGLAVFVFLVFRAIRVPLTYDEAATYERYLAADFLSLFNFDLATNHLLNTLLAKASHVAFGDSELALRAPNLAGYVLYATFSALLLRAWTRPVIAMAGFLLLNLNPYLLDFFALCRGYGLSLGLLMGAVYFFFGFLDRAASGHDVVRPLARSLGFACAAVTANLTLLNVYAALAVIAIGRLAWRRVPPAASTREAGTPRRRAGIGWLPWVAAVFTALVLSQDVRLSNRLYEPMAVRLAGLEAAALGAAEVVALEVTGRPVPFERAGSEAVWRYSSHAARIRVEVPLSAARDLEGVDVTIGDRTFEHGRREGGWIAHEEGPTWVLESAPALSLPRSRLGAYRSIVNWRGDMSYAALLLAYTALALAALGGVALLLTAAGRAAVRAGLVTAGEWRPLQTATLWLAALTGPPLYVLYNNRALYFGGTRGLVPDTFLTLVEGSLYGKAYRFADPALVFGVLAAITVVSIVVLGLASRRGHAAAAVRAAAVLAALTIASAALVVQAFLFATPYLVGRTALFYIPLFVLFVVLSGEAAARLGRAAAAAAISTLVIAAGMSVAHVGTSANVSAAREWQADAGTKQMIDDLAFVAAFERPPGSPLVLGVDWMYSTAAVFYAKRQPAFRIDVIVVPSPRAVDYLYLDERNREETINVIRRYPVSGTVLARGISPP